MLPFDRRVTLEDQFGQRHPVCVVETIDGHHFVLVAVAEAGSLQDLQAAGAPLWKILAVLERAVTVMDVRSHAFLSPEGRAAVLGRSAHLWLRLIAARLDDASPAEETQDALSAHAFLEECRRRSG
ncbi:MAG: hypothetical protein VKQ33_13645 [Candidatus Sericytochromatia bacterium]|nr:hypothetical protein [Candidatus Sericytochromatia bacterium]